MDNISRAWGYYETKGLIYYYKIRKCAAKAKKLHYGFAVPQV